MMSCCVTAQQHLNRSCLLQLSVTCVNIVSVLFTPGESAIHTGRSALVVSSLGRPCFLLSS